MGAIAAWLDRWGRVCIGYGLVVAALILLCRAIDSLLGLGFPNLLNADALYGRITSALQDIVTPLTDMVSALGPDQNNFGKILLYCIGLDGIISGIDLLVSMLSASVSVTTTIFVAAIACLIADFFMRKTRWFASAVSGVSPGGD